MTLNKDNDVYQGDLVTLNARKQAWASGDVTTVKYSRMKWVVLAVGFVCIIIAMLLTSDAKSSLETLPLHLTIWATALAVYLVTRRGKVISQQPFYGFHHSRFEVDDDTLYYVFQKGMSLRTYYIKDDAISRIYRDDDAGVLLIEGEGTINIQTRKKEYEEQVNEFYALVPFDSYDLDDLLDPYRKRTVHSKGKLRARYTEENILNRSSMKEA